MSDNAAKLLQDHKHLIPDNSPVPNRRILVVDDEPEIGNAVKRILSPETGGITSIARSSRSSGLKRDKVKDEFEVTVVTTPEQAIAAVSQSMAENLPFAMGFFDVVLNAKMDGIELVKQLLGVDRKLYAVFVTAYHDRSVDTIGSFLGEGNRERWDYINKPFTEGEILQKARNTTSLWDLHRLKEWQQERLSEAHQLLLQHDRQNTAAAVGRGVAHEFGNLLTHILGNAEIALEKKNDADGMKGALEVILKATNTATDVLQRFRKLNSGEQKAVHKPIDVWQALEEAIELVDFQLRKRFIRVSKVKSQKLLVPGNKHSFVQIFVNLFINSMHAMPDGGDIQVGVQQKDGNAVISVRDTGPGVPEKILHRLTEPLFTTKGAAGSGLGLSICKEIVEFEHGGELAICNHARGGLEVLITLPLNVPEPEERRTSRERHQDQFREGFAFDRAHRRRRRHDPEDYY